MRITTNCFKCVVIFLVILVLVCYCDCTYRKNMKSKYKRKIDSAADMRHNNNSTRQREETAIQMGRGFLIPSGILSLSRVVNFFPVGGERECQPEGYNIAKAGICLNTYDCRQRDGKAAGDCAHGLGVCCVFEVSCGGAVQNNLTYFMSPGFPELWSGEHDCNITIDKTYAGIMQLRIDFLHFTIGQPNRTTGACDEDAMVLGDGETKFTLCGQNHGQHIYYTLSSSSEKREAGELAGTKTINLSMRMRGGDMPRIWLMRLAQMPLAYTAPHSCLQYYTSHNGTIRTFNYASNGRHLADQEYKSCIRRNVGFCSVRYTPCDERSFRIGLKAGDPTVIDPVNSVEPLGPGGSGGPGTGFYGPDGSFAPASVSTTTRSSTVGGLDQMPAELQNDTIPNVMMPSDDIQTQDDEIEGSGMDPQIETPATASQPSMLSRIWSYIWPWTWGQRSIRSWPRWSAYAQHYPDDDDRFRYFGYGNFGVGLVGFGRQRCQDRITIPCENEYFVSDHFYTPGVCDPHHCGSTFCPGQTHSQCRIETSISPFAVSVHFGPPTVKRSPEENIGVCLRYTQLPCNA